MTKFKIGDLVYYKILGVHGIVINIKERHTAIMYLHNNKLITFDWYKPQFVFKLLK